MAGNKPLTLITSAASLFIGLGIGYMVAEKRLSAMFDERLAAETEQMKTFYTLHGDPKEKYATAEEAAAALLPESKVNGWHAPTIEFVERTEYHKVAKQYNNVQDSRIVPGDDPEEEHALEAEYGSVTEVIGPDGTLMMSGEVTSNVFVDYASSIQVISLEEFNDDTNYIQNTLTWYTKDRVLADEHEDRIEEVASVVGLEFEKMFGVKSGDSNVVHVRNHNLSLDYEVVLSPSSYAEEIRGEVYDPPIIRPSDRINRGE